MAALNAEYAALFHGNAAVEDEEDRGGLMVHSWFEGRKQALLADWVIGTVDQLLMASLKQKHLMLRHLGLAGKVAVIDEVHSFDAYMNEYFENAIAWLGAYHTPVILLSATLPAERRIALVRAYLQGRGGGKCKEPDDALTERLDGRDYPLLTWTDGDEVHTRPIPRDDRGTRQVWIDRLQRPAEAAPEDDGAQVATYLQAKLREGGCAVVVLNTVQRAQDVEQALRQAMPHHEVQLVHALYMMEDRAAWEEALMARLGKRSTPQTRDGLIVVGTQVLEQSLDIDADVMVTDLCPMDLLLQRSGRLHRHQRVRPAPLAQAHCAVLMGQELEKGAQMIYGDWLLLRTQALLPQAVTLPDSIPTLVQETYAAPQDLLAEGMEAQAYEAYCEGRQQARQKAKAFRLQKPLVSRRPERNTINGMLDAELADDDQHGQAAVRDGEPSVEVLLMVRHADGRIGYVPWHEEGRIVPFDRAPHREEQLCIARQRIRLPRRVCGYGQRRMDDTIRMLEHLTAQTVAEWQTAGLLRGELFLFLDENGQAALNGYALTYTQHEGLRCTKEDGHEG